MPYFFEEYRHSSQQIFQILEYFDCCINDDKAFPSLRRFYYKQHILLCISPRRLCQGDCLTCTPCVESFDCKTDILHLGANPFKLLSMNYGDYMRTSIFSHMCEFIHMSISSYLSAMWMNSWSLCIDPLPLVEYGRVMMYSMVLVDFLHFLPFLSSYLPLLELLTSLKCH